MSFTSHPPGPRPRQIALIRDRATFLSAEEKDQILRGAPHSQFSLAFSRSGCLRSPRLAAAVPRSTPPAWVTTRALSGLCPPAGTAERVYFVAAPRGGGGGRSTL